MAPTPQNQSPALSVPPMREPPDVPTVPQTEKPSVPFRPFPRWPTRFLLVAIPLCLFFGIKGCSAWVCPYFAQPFAWTMASAAGPTLTSPDGKRTVTIWFNDAGAAHSGNHWTWVVEHHWLWGRVVVASGFLDPGYRREWQTKVVPLEWLDDNRFEITFSDGRYHNPSEATITRRG